MDLLEGKRRSGIRLADSIKTHAEEARGLAGMPAQSPSRDHVR